MSFDEKNIAMPFRQVTVHLGQNKKDTAKPEPIVEGADPKAAGIPDMR
jgi:hypothetical protein